jgi:hypothetical protein
METFSHTMAGQAYDNYAAFWLMEVAYYALFSTGGPALIVFFHSLLVTAAYVLLLRLCRQVSRSWRIAAASTFFAAVLGFESWNVRPQAIAFLAGVVVLSAIYGYRSYQRYWLLAIPPVACLMWANSHGSFVIGLLMLGIWLADETVTVLKIRFGRRDGWALARIWPPALTLLASGIACLGNPRGIGTISYVLNLSGNPVIRSLVPEWAPPSFAERGGALFLVALLLSAILLAVSPRRPNSFQLLSYVTFGALALSSTRGVIWFGIVMAPVLADQLAALNDGWSRTNPARRASRDRPGLNYLFAAILCVGVLLALPWFKHLLPLPSRKAGLISRETPVVATQVLLREHPPTSIFNEQGFGSYLIWAAQPEYPVFVDTRLELYPMEIWRDYLDISAARAGWQEKLTRYGVNTLMLSFKAQSNLIKAVRTSSNWRLLYEDDVAVIFERIAGQQ